jgi:hypothetical protein
VVGQNTYQSDPLHLPSFDTLCGSPLHQPSGLSQLPIGTDPVQARTMAAEVSIAGLLFEDLQLSPVGAEERSPAGSDIGVLLMRHFWR